MCDLLVGKERVLFLAGDIHKNKYVGPKKVKGSSLRTPIQLISSGMYVNSVGLGIPVDDRRNWALLELSDDAANVTFHTKHGIEYRKSRKSNELMRAHFFSGA